MPEFDRNDVEAAMTPSDAIASWNARPHEFADADAVYDVIRAAEACDLGRVIIELEDITSDWRRPSFDLRAQSMGFYDGDRMVACAELHRNRLEGYVHPDFRGRGLGSAILEWATAKGREMGCPSVGLGVPSTMTDAVALLRSRGWEPVWTSWILSFPRGSELPAVTLPSGYILRDFEPARDARDVYETFEQAFSEWPDRTPVTFEDWRTGIERSDFEDWQMLTVLDTSPAIPRIVGACEVAVVDNDGWVGGVAVSRSARRQGLARALLAAGFRATQAHGADTFSLSTDSRTGALDLYLHIGMEVVETFVRYALDLSPSDT